MGVGPAEAADASRRSSEAEKRRTVVTLCDRSSICGTSSGRRLTAWTSTAVDLSRQVERASTSGWRRAEGCALQRKHVDRTALVE